MSHRTGRIVDTTVTVLLFLGQAAPCAVAMLLVSSRQARSNLARLSK